MAELGTNRALLMEAVLNAAGAGAHVIALPELAASGYMFEEQSELQASTQTCDGETLQDWKILAEELDVVIVGGFAQDGVMVVLRTQPHWLTRPGLEPFTARPTFRTSRRSTCSPLLTRFRPWSTPDSGASAS